MDKEGVFLPPSLPFIPSLSASSAVQQALPAVPRLHFEPGYGRFTLDQSRQSRGLRDLSVKKKNPLSEKCELGKR